MMRRMNTVRQYVLAAMRFLRERKAASSSSVKVVADLRREDSFMTGDWFFMIIYDE